jgi:hypothetical protein
VSHLFPEKVTVWLSSDSISFIQSGGRKSEANPCVLVMPFDQNESEKSLDHALLKYKEMHPRAAKFSVILSNAFVHYLLLESQAEIKTLAEERVYVEYKYREVFDQLSNSLTFSWDTGLNCRSVLSSATSTHLMTSLKDACKRHGFEIDSIQPYLMLLFNKIFTKQRDYKRFALIEGGQFIYFDLADGQWGRVHQRYCPSDLNAQIDVLIQRENLLSNMDLNDSRIFIISPSKDIQLNNSFGRLLCLTPEDVLMKNKSYDLTFK